MVRKIAFFAILRSMICSLFLYSIMNYSLFVQALSSHNSPSPERAMYADDTTPADDADPAVSNEGLHPSLGDNAPSGLKNYWPLFNIRSLCNRIPDLFYTFCFAFIINLQDCALNFQIVPPFFGAFRYLC